jgi:hypothetical protein
VSQLPVGWTFATLKDLASPEPRAITDGPFGSKLKTSHYTTNGPRVIRLQNIGDFRFNDDRAHISQEHFQELRAHEVQQNDLLIAGLGEQLPRACLAPASIGQAVVKADCFRIRLHPSISPGYVCAVLNSPQVRSVASQQISGVGRPRLSLQKVRDIRLSVPPAAEQKRIVAAIEQQFSRLDAGVAPLENALRRVRAMRHAIRFAAVGGRLVAQDPSDEPAAELINRARPTGRFRGTSALPGQLPDLPRGWTWAPMGRLARRVTVGHVGPMKNRYVSEGVPFLRSQNVRADRFEPRGLLFIPPEFHEQLRKSRLEPGDLVIVRSGNVGTACVVPDSLGVANCADLVIVQGPEAINPSYGALYMNSLARKWISAGRVGVALTHFNTNPWRSCLFRFHHTASSFGSLRPRSG